ncbi:MAG: sulfotransferase [Phycisphaerales bacterium]|nr:sulfotransferase [Phycisphaerales bacterium]
MRQPDFIIIGAMKCATSTLHDQLAAQPGVFMSTPKEPNFFSDDPQFARGPAWYHALFDGAHDDDLCGESSTHYTKLPTYPKTIERLASTLGNDVRFIYMMRHPIDRLVSHYIHEWTQRTISDPIDVAVRRHAELIEYSRYAYQLAPWIEAFGARRILPVFFERFVAEPQQELQRVAAFIGHTAGVHWVDDLERRNVSSERLRTSVMRDLVVDNVVARTLRRTFVPKSLRDRVKSFWTMENRPELSPALRAEVEAKLDDDLATLSAWWNLPLTCASFTEVARSGTPTWHAHPAEVTS